MVQSRPRRPPSCLQNTTTLYRHLTAAGSWEWYDHGHDGPPRVCRIQLHCTHTLQLQVLGSSTITATTAPLVFAEYNYIVPTPYSCRFLGVVRSRPRRPPSCLQNITTLYRHLTDPGSWEQYDHGHDGPPRVCRIQLHCTNTLQLQVLGNGTITVTTAPLVFVEYNYIVPTPWTAAGSWEQYDHGHDGPPRVCRIQLHCTDTLQLQVLGSSTITATTAPLVFVEYNYIVPTPYRSRFLGVVRSRPRRPPLVFVEYNYIVPTPYSCRFLGVVRSRPRRPPRVCRIQLHSTDSCRFLGVVRSRPRRPPSCLQNITTLYRHLTDPGSWEQYDHGHDGPPRVCRIQLHCTDTLQLQVLGSSTITATTAPLVFVE